MGLGGNTSAVVALALDLAVIRHNVLASNIANSATSGYIPKKVSFEAVLDRIASIHEGREGHSVVEALRNQVRSADRFVTEAGAAVSVDQQVAQVTQNALHYEALVTGLKKRSEIINAAIDAGKV